MVVDKQDTLANQFILPEEERIRMVALHETHKEKLEVPRRPAWDKSTTPAQLDEMERHAFLEWRRGLVVLEETLGLLMTPYERNIQVWRQLWRVVERSDMIVQIVDARNPLLFHSLDVSRYVKQVDQRKKNLMLVNKADMLGQTQRLLLPPYSASRLAWANYFIENGIEYRFFSAAIAKKIQEDEILRNEVQASESAAQRVADNLNISDSSGKQSDKSDSWEEISSDIIDDLEIAECDTDDDGEMDVSQASDKEKIRVLGVDELLELFMAECPKPLRETGMLQKFVYLRY